MGGTWHEAPLLHHSPIWASEKKTPQAPCHRTPTFIPMISGRILPFKLHLTCFGEQNVLLWISSEGTTGASNLESFFLTVCPEREQSNRAGAFTTSAQLPTPKHGKQKHFMSMRKKETVPPTKLRYPTLGSSENHLQICQTSGGYVSSVVPERATMSCKELSNTLQGTITSPTKREEKNHGLKSTFGMGYLRSRKDGISIGEVDQISPS